MKKQILVLGVLFLILGGVVGFYAIINVMLPKGPLVITAYDGPIATMNRIDDSYPDGGSYPIVREVGVSHALVYPDSFDGWDLGTSSGLKCEINAAPNVIDFEPIDTISELDVDADAKTNTSESLAVQIVKGTMGVKIQTYSGGTADCYPTTFWIKLSENDFSVFQGVEESYAAFIDVYTVGAPVVYGDLDIQPSTGGSNIDMEPLGVQPPTPEWISRLYGGVENLRIVEFPLIVHRGHAEPGLIITTRAEAYADFTIGFDVILFGYWTQVHDYREWDAGIPDFWGDLYVAVVAFMWYFAGIVVTGLAIWKLKGKTLIAVLIGTWVLVLWMSGFFDSILGASGG